MAKPQAWRWAVFLAVAMALSASPAVAKRKKPKPPPTVRQPSGTPWLGVTFSGSVEYVLIEEVMPGSPAANAGIVRGDLIVEWDGQPALARGFQTVVASRLIGESVPIRIKRLGALVPLKVVLAAKPSVAEIMRLRFIGRPADDFTLPVVGATDSTVSLSDLAGEVIVLQFTASHCVQCRGTWAALSELEARKAHVFLVFTDDPQTCENFVVTNKPPFPVIRETSYSRAQQFMAPGLPVVMVIDRNGTTRHITDASSPQEIKELHRATLAALAEPRPTSN